MKEYWKLTDEQLLELALTKGLHDEELNEEWYSRYKMNFPYRLNFQKRIVNCLSYKVVRDEDCDKLILNQAKELRSVL